ncbi:MAG: hypothetical protein HKN51_08960 [Saprospiraceae bacterium]|nr:hypothetical protein [Saprospiraceae bacterium]
MKTLLALLFTINLSASVSPEFIITNYYDPSIVISFEAWKGGDLSVRILTEDSELIFNDNLKIDETDGVKYNLKNLKSGKYLVKLENDIKLVEETVILFDGKIVKKEAKIYYKPVVVIKKDLINLSFLSYNGDVDVTIFGDEGELYSSSVENTKPYNRIYSISDLPQGSYTIDVRNDKVSRTISFRR